MTEPTKGAEKKIIEHPLKKIEFTLEPGKTRMTAEDEKLVKACVKLHDFELKLTQCADEAFAFSLIVNERIAKKHQSLLQVKDTLKECSALADKLGDTTYVEEEVSIEKLLERQLHTSEILQEYHTDMMELYKEITVLHKKIADFNHMDEEEGNEVYESYETINLKHCSNYEINSIDIVLHDDAHNDFLNYRSTWNDRRKSLIDLCDETIIKYNELNLENTALYAVWDEFLKRCKLLKAVADLHQGVIGSHFN